MPAKKRARSKAAPRIDPRRKSFFDHLDDTTEQQTTTSQDPPSALKSQLGSPTSIARRDAQNRRMSTRRSIQHNNNNHHTNASDETHIDTVPASPFELRHEGAFVFKKRKPLQQQQQQQQNNKSKQSQQKQDDDAEEQQTNALQHAKSVAQQLATDGMKVDGKSDNTKKSSSFPNPPLVPLYSSSQANALRLQFSVAPMQELTHAIQQHYALNLHDEQQKAAHFLSSSSQQPNQFDYVQHAITTVSTEFLSSLEKTMHEALLRGGEPANAKDSTSKIQPATGTAANADGVETLQSRWRHIKEKSVLQSNFDALCKVLMLNCITDRIFNSNNLSRKYSLLICLTTARRQASLNGMS
jgi:hypothetical protein